MVICPTPHPTLRQVVAQRFFGSDLMPLWRRHGAAIRALEAAEEEAESRRRQAQARPLALGATKVGLSHDSSETICIIFVSNYIILSSGGYHIIMIHIYIYNYIYLVQSTDYADYVIYLKCLTCLTSFTCLGSLIELM